MYVFPYVKIPTYLDTKAQKLFLLAPKMNVYLVPLVSP